LTFYGIKSLPKSNAGHKLHKFSLIFIAIYDLRKNSETYDIKTENERKKNNL